MASTRGPNIKGAIAQKFSEKGYDINKESVWDRITDPERWKQFASESAIGRANAIGKHMIGLTKGLEQPNPMLALEAAGLATGLGRGGGGPANLGVIQKRLLKEAGQDFRVVLKSTLPDNPNRNLRREIAKTHMKDIQGLSDVAAGQINSIRVPPDGLRSRELMGSIHPLTDDMVLNLGAWKAKKGVVHHETGHAMHSGRVMLLDSHTNPNSKRIEKVINYRGGIIQDVMKRWQDAVKLDEGKKMRTYDNTPHEHLARRMESYQNKFKPEKFNNRSESDTEYISALNKESKRILDALKKTAPKTYEHAVRKSTSRMRRTYGPYWLEDLVPKKRK